MPGECNTLSAKAQRVARLDQDRARRRAILERTRLGLAELAARRVGVDMGDLADLPIMIYVGAQPPPKRKGPPKKTEKHRAHSPDASKPDAEFLQRMRGVTSQPRLDLDDHEA